MKLKLMTLLIATLSFSAIVLKAQQPDESRIKIMRTEKPGVLRLVHAITTTEPVTVRFITDQGIVSSDEITGSFPKGLSKRYDIRQISSKDFHMEISTSRLTVTYHIVPSIDKKTFNSYLEKTVHNYDVLASRN